MRYEKGTKFRNINGDIFWLGIPFEVTVESYNDKVVYLKYMCLDKEKLYKSFGRDCPEISGICNYDIDLFNLWVSTGKLVIILEKPSLLDERLFTL